MNTIPAQEIKRRGIAAVDDFLLKGDVHVIRNNKPQYVVLSEEHYQELVAEANEACLARVRTSLDEVKQGKVRNFSSADELLKALDEAYEKLTRVVQANMSVHSHTVMEWFAIPSSGASTKEEIDQRLNDERNSWDKA